MDFKLNTRKKTLRQLVVALLLLCTIGLPIQNIVLANELSTTEEVITEEAESAITAETDTSNSESMENDSVPPSEKEAESTEITSSETLLEESKGLTDTSEVNSSEITEASSATQQNEKRPSTKAVTTGTFPNRSTATWSFDDTTGELSISAGTLVNPNKSLADLIGVPTSQIKSIVFEGQVVASGSLSSLFEDAVNVTSLDLSDFDTSNVTDMHDMFWAVSGLTSLDLSDFDTSNVTNMLYMFNGASKLQNLTLGDKFQFVGTNAILPNPTPTANYTGKWQNVGSGTVNKPKGSFIGTATELMSTYDGSTMADTYVWQPMLIEVNVQDSVLMVGDTWKPEDNFLSALDNAENPVDFKDITVTGSVDTTQPGVYKVDYSYDGVTSTATITVLAPVVVNVKDSTLIQGDTWNASDNFLDATDDAGNPVSFQDITVSGSVDTTQPGVYKVDYSYDGVTSTATITVFETMPESWINFIVDGTNVRAIPGSLLSKAEWDLTTGLWAGWNPGTIKVPTDKLPSAPVKEGYTFKGWQDTTGTIVDFSTLEIDLNSTTEFNFTAGYEKNTYNVTFNVDGRQEQQTVLFDELISEPTTPTKDGYLFTGWYDSPTGGDKWDFSTDKMPAKNVELYAHFKELMVVTPGVDPVPPSVVKPITPEVDPVIPSVVKPITPGVDPVTPSVVKPIMPGVDPVTPSVNPPTTPGEGPNVVSPTTPGSGGNQPPSNGSGSNTGNTTTPSPTTSQRGKLAKLGENSSLLLQGFGLLLVLSGLILFWKKRKRTHL
ncbi:BspA family leucine-rich repeat surface protein [Listeria monocytogenes]|nr:BspA family leucine-rich repeat surface protein [Listeria monocytogenes]EAD8590496.1 BspA family leucine-rich repeat surface protein [Listeria monocytogenes]EAD8593634.1 BspA family leucine-rich repeat surface protein [Listeria monocytogenes]EAD8602538.1 BspA family leucine-rich repeat surface protein [Listeria monocytogenes]